jgi:MoaA/NifB/PqqE/SkfB family radical SAM enzyme
MFNIETPDEIFELSLCHAQINITTDCNMRCIHCRGAYESKQVINLGLSDFRSILQFTQGNLGEGAGYLISGGEPLKHPQFKELMVELSKYPKDGEFVTITTNGSLLKKSTLDFLQELDFPELRISISLDSAVPEIHNSFRKFDKAFQKALQAIRLVGERPEI